MRTMRDIKWLLVRYGVLIVVLGASLVGVFFIFQGLIQQRELIEKESRINIWFLAQTEIEFIRFTESLKDYELNPGRRSASDARARFEIFWSRLPPLLEGSQTADLRAIEGVVPSVKNMIGVLEELEPEMAKLEELTPEQLDTINEQLDDLRGPVHDLVRRALLYESTEVSQARERHDELYQQLLGLFALILAGGLAMLVMLLIQIVKTNRAIVAKEHAATEAIAARKELELAINSISEGFIIYDQDDRVELFNQRYIDLHPMQADDMKIGVSFQDLLRSAVRNGGVKIPPDQVEDWIASICAKRRESDEAEFESRVENGTWLRISERWTSDGRLVGVHTDITELKKRETLVEEKSELLQTTLDNMKQGIAVFDADMNLTLFNNRYLEINQYPEDFFVTSRTYRELATFAATRGDLGPGDPDALARAQEAAIKELLRTRSGSLRQTRDLSDKRIVETIVAALPTGGFVKTYEDITERVASENERARLTEMYHSAQRTHALGTLAGGIAHDFNNIIGSIIGNCSLLMSDGPKDTSSYQRLRQILDSGTRARDLVRQIMTYSRNAGSDRKPLDLSKTLRESVKTLEPLLPPRISLQVGQIDPCIIDGDATQIHQVLQNVCTNASQAIGKDTKGRITVSLKHVTVNAAEHDASASRDADWPGSARSVRGQAGTLHDGHYACLTVTDTGSGIAEEIMPRIFEPFYTTKQVGEGTGLGLAAVHGIIRNHNGAIIAESMDGFGTRFDFYFPAVDATAPVLPGTALNLTAEPGSERVFLIDDDKMLLSVTREILMRLGYTVKAFSEPEEALEAFRANPNVWDIVITDRLMPKLNGEELSAAIRKLRADIPILMLSGFVSGEEVDRILGVGVNAVVGKPVLPEELSDAVRKALGGDARDDDATSKEPELVE